MCSQSLAAELSITMHLLFTIGVIGIAAAAATVGPNVAYFRNHNMDHSSKIAVSTDATSVTLSTWDTPINIFDSVNDVKVQRIDVVGSAGATVSLYSDKVPLHLDHGPMYIFHNATKLVINDQVGKSYSASKSDAVSWMSKGSCLHFSVQLSADGEASLMMVTSGSVNWNGDATMSQSCDAATVLIGAGTVVGGGSFGGWVYNEVSYTLTDSQACKTPLQHGNNGYSQTDEPIGPLAAHYHTRGALYYNQYGKSKFNDEAAPNDTLYQGELRFVNAGVYYGPEEMDRDTCFVASVHESDPAAVSPISESPTSECPFACMNTIEKGTFAKCTKKAEERLMV
jgi:hypothetical protein